MRIVVRAPDVSAARTALAKLAAAGVETSTGVATTAPCGGDILVAVADGGVAEFAAHAMDSATPPIACLLGYFEGTPPVGGAVAPFLGAISFDAPPPLLRAQIDAWTRLAVAREERERRSATAAALGAPAPRPYAAGASKALYVGTPNTMFLVLERALAAEGVTLAAALSAYNSFDHLHDDVFDAVILNAAEDARAAISLCAALRRNAALFDVPTMVMTAQGDASTAAQALKRGACAIVETNADHMEGVGWLLQAMRRERQRRAVGHDLRALRDVMGDARTGLWRGEAFTRHFDRLALDHRRSGRPLSLAVMRVMPAHGARTPSHESWTRAFSEVATMVGRLARESDCAAAIGADLIVVALPAADRKAAVRTCARIASVAECTAFVSSEDSAPLVFEQCAVELQPSESGRALLTRALRALDVERIPA